MAKQVKEKKAKRPRKKIILFIVEGQSDYAALERPILTLLQGNYDGINAEFLVADCDITSDIRNHPGNIEQKIKRSYINPFFSDNPFYQDRDILEVVQICDLDGTFIPDEFCQKYDAEHTKDGGFIYDPPQIYGETVDAVLDRNHRKAENIRYLLSLGHIKLATRKCPYSLYFFSSNLDHYLHDKLNLSGRDKIHYAETFADRCDEDPDFFLKRLCRHSQAMKNMSYEESWNRIAEDTHSIKRHTNFNLYLEGLLSRFQELN